LSISLQKKAYKRRLTKEGLQKKAYKRRLKKEKGRLLQSAFLRGTVISLSKLSMVTSL